MALPLPSGPLAFPPPLFAAEPHGSCQARATPWPGTVSVVLGVWPKHGLIYRAIGLAREHCGPCRTWVGSTVLYL